VKAHAFTTTPEEFEFADIAPVHKAFPAVVRGEYDVAELALVTFLQAFDSGLPVTLLPVTLLGRFQHHTLVTTRGPEVTAESLAGKRVGVRAWSQTTGVWVRGFLADDYGIDVESVDWVVYESGHVDGFADPSYATRATSANSLPVDFLAGAVDAAILGNELPDDPRARTLLSDPARAAAAWYGRSGAIPVNHVVVASDDFARGHGELLAELTGVLAGSMPHPPVVSSEPDFYPAGFEALRPSLELACGYAFAQGITSRRITVDEVRAKTEQLTGVDLGSLTAAGGAAE
jgi:4,5-dihydroxyphthalate decarboxylase